MTSSNEKLTNEEIFIKYHDKLRQQLNLANGNFTIYKDLANLAKGYMNEINQAPGFFGFTVNAHILLAVIRLNIFFDKRQKSLSIRRFLDFAQNNLGIFSKQNFEKRLRDKGTYDSHWVETRNEVTNEKVEKHRKIVKDLPVSNLRTWRNNIIAHIDATSVRENIEVGGKYPIKINHVETIINALDDILNYYLLAYECRSWSRDLSFKHDIKIILDAIRSDLEIRRKASKSAELKSRES